MAAEVVAAAVVLGAAGVAGVEAVRPFCEVTGTVDCDTALVEVVPPVLLTRVFILLRLRNRRGRGASLYVEDAGDCGLKSSLIFKNIIFMVKGAFKKSRQIVV